MNKELKKICSIGQVSINTPIIEIYYTSNDNDSDERIFLRSETRRRDRVDYLLGNNEFHEEVIHENDEDDNVPTLRTVILKKSIKRAEKKNINMYEYVMTHLNKSTYYHKKVNGIELNFFSVSFLKENIVKYINYVRFGFSRTGGYDEISLIIGKKCHREVSSIIFDEYLKSKMNFIYDDIIDEDKIIICKKTNKSEPGLHLYESKDHFYFCSTEFFQEEMFWFRVKF